MRKLLQLLIVVFVFSGGISAAHAGGVQIGRTRVIYNANDKEEALPIINKGADTPGWFNPGLIPVTERRVGLLLLPHHCFVSTRKKNKASVLSGPAFRYQKTENRCSIST